MGFAMIKERPSGRLYGIIPGFGHLDKLWGVVYRVNKVDAQIQATPDHLYGFFLRGLLPVPQ
jgi:hypothetical protein